MRNERQALGESNRRNFKVMRADPLSDALQGIANLGVVTCGRSSNGSEAKGSRNRSTSARSFTGSRLRAAPKRSSAALWSRRPPRRGVTREAAPPRTKACVEGTRCRRSCRAGTSRLRQRPPLELRLRRTLESRILDCPFDGFEPPLGPVPLGFLSNGKFDPMPDEGRQLGEAEGRRTENSVDSNGGHVGRVARTARTDPRQGEASPAFRGAAGHCSAGWGGSKRLWRVRSRRSCGATKFTGQSECSELGGHSSS